MAASTPGSTESHLIPYHRPKMPAAAALERATAFWSEMASRRSIRMFSADPVPRSRSSTRS